LYRYYSPKLTKTPELYKTPIYNAIRKYGFSSFSLEILEYCDNSLNILEREQYYIDKLKPEYNILKIAGSSLGFKHSESTLGLFKIRKLDEEGRKNLSLAATGRILTHEEREKISKARKGIVISEVTKKKISLATIKLRGISVIVIDTRTGEKLFFTNLTEAANFLGVSRTAISKSIKTNMLLKKIYLIQHKK